MNAARFSIVLAIVVTLLSAPEAFGGGLLPPARTADPALTPKTQESSDSGDRHPLTPEMQAAFGSATWIPADYEFYLADHRLKWQALGFWNSRAFKSIRNHPLAQLGVAQLMKEVDWATIAARYETLELRAGLAVAIDGISDEVFVAGGPGSRQWLDAAIESIAHLFFLSVVSAAENQGEADPRALESELIAFVPKLIPSQFPPILLGCRCEDSEFLIRVLEAGYKRLKSQPEQGVEIARQEFDGSTSYVLELDLGLASTMILGRRGDEPSKFDLAVHDRLQGRVLVVTATLRGSYFVLGVASNTDHVAQIQSTEAKASLAASTKFAPLRRHFGPKVLRLSYRKASQATLSIDPLLTRIRSALGASIPADRIDPLFSDLGTFLGEVTTAMPEHGDLAEIMIWNQGYERWRYGPWSSSPLESSSPLTLLRNRGEQPLMLLAQRNRKTAPDYEAFSRWTQVFTQHLTAILESTLPKESLAEFNDFRRVFFPLAKTVDNVLKNDLLPAIDGGESVLVLDGKWEVREVSGVTPFDTPLQLPRLSLVIQVEDREKLIRGVRRLRDAVNQAAAQLAKQQPQLTPFEIPNPTVTTTADQTLYSYSIPGMVALGLLPHARVTADRVALSLFPEHSLSLLNTSAASTSTTTPAKLMERARWDAASGSVQYVELDTLWQLVSHNVVAIAYKMVELGEIPPMASGLVALNAPLVAKAMGAVKRYEARTYRDGDFEVQHSWLRIEDLPE